MEIIPGPGENAAAYALEALTGLHNLQKKLSTPKADSLLFRVGMSPESLAKMKVLRKQIYNVAVYLEAQGSSDELTMAFRSLEQALHYGIKHFCLTDPSAKKEEL